MVNKYEDFKLVDSDKTFTHKDKYILMRNKNFFSSNVKYIEEMLNIIDGGKNGISIRVLDFFLVNYSKEHGTWYRIRKDGVEKVFNVYNEFKCQLSGYSKNYFDPFCRKKKIVYTYKNYHGKHKISFMTSIGQLNFFNWAIRNGIINYIKKNLTEIEKSMKEKYIKDSNNQKSDDDSEDSIDNTISESDDDNISLVSTSPDPLICNNSDKLNSIHISSTSKSSTKSGSERRKKRRQLSTSVYDHGIKKTNITIRLDFD